MLPLATVHPHYMPVLNVHAFLSEKSALSSFMPGCESTLRVDDTPPGKAGIAHQKISDRPSASWVTGFFSNLTVCDDISALEGD